MTQRIVVVGGGIGGLATAWRLQDAARQRQQTCAITLCEADAAWGGVTRSSRRDGFLMEHGPDAMIRTKPAGLVLMRDLGLEERVLDTDPANRSACILRGERLLPVPDGLYLMAPGRFLPFALSPMISWPGKLRMALDLVLPRHDPSDGEESLADFVRRRLGREALERLAQPMIGGIYTADPERLSLDLAMPQFRDMEREHRSLILAMRANRKKQAAAASASGPRYGLFVSLRGGLQELVDALVAGLAQEDLRLHTAVRAIAATADGWQVALADRATIEADAVVLCVPGHIAAGLVRGQDPVLADELGSMTYGSVATCNIAVRRDQLERLPAAAGFVVPAVERRGIIACTFASQKFPERAPEDAVLLRTFLGGALQPQQLEGDDATVTERAVAELRRILGLRGDPLFTRLDRWERSMPQPELGHGQRMQRIRGRLEQQPGLHLVGSGYDGIGIPDVVAQADRLAPLLIDALAARSATP